MARTQFCLHTIHETNLNSIEHFSRFNGLGFFLAVVTAVRVDVADGLEGLLGPGAAI